LGRLHGQGLHGDTWMIVLAIIALVAHQYFGFQHPRTKIRWVTLALNLFIFMASVIFALEGTRFSGATARIDISLGWLIIPASIFFFLNVANLRKLSTVIENYGHPWSGTNTAFTGGAAMLLIPQIMLFQLGSQHGSFDLYGIILTAAQWMFLNLGFMRWKQGPRH
jgi:hypothetical protein